MKEIKIIIEKHPEGYVAYPLGLKGVIIGEGETYEDALKDVKSAIEFHIETFGKGVTPLTMPNHDKIRASTLRVICRESGISREDFLKAYEKR